MRATFSLGAREQPALAIFNRIGQKRPSKKGCSKAVVEAERGRTGRPAHLLRAIHGRRIHQVVRLLLVTSNALRLHKCTPLLYRLAQYVQNVMTRAVNGECDDTMTCRCIAPVDLVFHLREHSAVRFGIDGLPR